MEFERLWKIWDAEKHKFKKKTFIYEKEKEYQAEVERVCEEYKVDLEKIEAQEDARTEFNSI